MTPWIGHSPRLVTRFFREWFTSFKIPERDYSFERFGTATRKYVCSQWFNLKSHSNDFALSLPVPKESMKTKYLASLLLSLTVLLSSCSQPETPEVDTASDESTSSSEAPTAKMGDLTEGVPGQVGFQHGIDCLDVDDCSVFFTVEELTQLPECDGYLLEASPESTNLIKATIRITTKDSEDKDFVPGDFPAWADWSALLSDGINKPLPSSDSCANEGTDHWGAPLKTGDTEIRTHYMDVPNEATALRLTDRRNGARWEFDLATELDKATSEADAPGKAEKGNAQVQQPTAAEPSPKETPLPQPPVQETPIEQVPASPPVRGFTGAPNVSEIEELDKTISHCGDPSIHQTGTTFFSDGSTGWTENCSAQMLG